MTINDEIAYSIELTYKLAESVHKRIFKRCTYSVIDLGRKRAGQAKLIANKVELNSQYLNEHKEHILKVTIPHEIAHLLTWSVYGQTKQWHGTEWREMMKSLGQNSDTYHHLELTPLPIESKVIAHAPVPVLDYKQFRLTTPLPEPSKLVQPIEWQKDASSSIVEVLSNHRLALLRAGTGTGKMYMTAQAIRELVEGEKLRSHLDSIHPMPVLWLTPKSVKTQTVRVVAQYGLTRHVNILSYSELRSTLGLIYIKWQATKNDKGETLAETPIWNTQFLPAIVVCDEVQVLKNKGSQISCILRALPDCVKVLCASATPYQRVIDAKALLVMGSMTTRYNSRPATEKNAEEILKYIASPRGTLDYSPSACERLRNELAPYVVELKNVRFKHKAHTTLSDIYFRDATERAAYRTLLDNLIKELNARRNSTGDISSIHYLVAMMKMQQGAEILRVSHIVERVLAKCETKAVVIGARYRETLDSVERRLVAGGLNPARIGRIVGGQTADERQKNVDAFQTGKIDIILVSYNAGGVGISLHHDRLTTKPRYIVIPPTWSAIDLAQILGRCHRLTSLSPTEQEILWYDEPDTCEPLVKAKVETKLKCISKSIVAKEQFTDVFIKQLPIDSAHVDTDVMMERVSEVVNGDKKDSSEDIDDDNDSLTGEGLENE